MTDLQTLNEAYLTAAASDPERLVREFDEITEYMKASTAIHHGEYVRTCYMPKLFTEAVFQRFAQDIRTLYGILGKVMGAYYRDPAYRALFGFDKVAEELILRADPAVSLLPMARIDFFYNEQTGAYKYCEFNTDGTSAMNEDRELNLAQQLSTVYRNFRAAHTTRTCELFESWVRTLCAVYQRARHTDQLPYVAIVDFMDCGTVNEFEVFQGFFVEQGVPAEVCDLRSLRYNAEEKVLYGPGGHKIDAIYRRAVTSDILERYAECGPLLAAVRDDAVLLVGDFHTQLVHNKTIFRILHEPQTQTLLTAEERAFVDAHVPLTKTFAASDIPRVLADKDAWILKPLDSYASRGVHAGVECTNEEWEAIVRSTPLEGYLLQEFYRPFVTENYGIGPDGTFGRNRYYNLTGVYVYDGVAQGIYSRVSLSPIISSQYSEKTLPTLLVDE